jgi:hypothetical protein
MSASQRNKGRRGEQQLVLWLRELGLDAERDGQPGKRDVRTKQPPVAWECKTLARCETQHKWLEQAERHADAGELAVVVVKANNKRRLVLLDAERFVNLVKEASVGRT